MCSSTKSQFSLCLFAQPLHLHSCPIPTYHFSPLSLSLSKPHLLSLNHHPIENPIPTFFFPTGIVALIPIPLHLMASFSSLSLPFLILFMAYTTTISASLPYHFTMRVSSISASPSLLPDPDPSPSPLSGPASSPEISPDISPLFPSPAPDSFPPSDSSLPTIPSSPSPPNPDAFSAPGPDDFAFAPSGFLPATTSTSSSLNQLNFTLFLSLVVLCFVLGM